MGIKNKNHSELEYYKATIREQKKTIKSLQQRIRQLEKHEHFFEELEEPEDFVPPKKHDPKNECKQPDCYGAIKVVMDLEFKELLECVSCGHRSSRIKHG